MAGGDARGANLPGGYQQLIELHVVVAMRARNRGAPREIILDEGTDDGFLEAPFKIDDVMRKPQMFGDAARVVDIIERAAALARGLFIAIRLGRKLREAPLIP